MMTTPMANNDAWVQDHDAGHGDDADGGDGSDDAADDGGGGGGEMTTWMAMG